MQQKLYFLSCLTLMLLTGCSTMSTVVKFEPDTPKIASIEPGMRHFTYADYMDKLMHTKNIEGLVEELGEPFERDPIYEGYIVYRYNMKYKLVETEVLINERCKMLFVTENPPKNGAIIGWQTDCDLGRENGIMHADAIMELDQKNGVLPIDQPIPQAVIPEAFKAAIEASKTRPETFPDFLHSYLGKSQQEIAMDKNFEDRLVKTEELTASNMVVETYTASWIGQEFHEDELIAFYEGWGLYPNGMVDIELTCPFTFYYSNGIAVGYDGENCKEFIFEGRTVPLNSKEAPWRLLN